ncbi:hypothetical protein EMPS_08114 [Entomortierella parvispora]|uniref:F-box domain-containing protein n=1 Tax=Entomortierella parvispora TaxID=205924 RepID=A0A9P3HFS3_9FUNG|nr:hypothetical protein EMPS_08114 [Entomortierella parvispora]
MDSLPKDLSEALECVEQMSISGKHPHNSIFASSATADRPFPLPVEIMLNVFDNLTVPELIPSQSVSRQFRIMSRTVLLDKLGGRFLQSLQQQWDCVECKALQEKRMQTRQWVHSPPRSASVGGGDMHGLPPLPNHHQSTNTAMMNQSQHQASHHLYQHQSMEDLGQHYQTDLHIFHQNHSYNIPSAAPLSSLSSSMIPSPEPQQSHQHPSLYHGQPRSHHHDPGFVAPGTVALFLFPHHDHTPTGWQDRQSVHFQCSGIDREREQLIFTPVIRENDSLKFNTNSWNLPSAPAAVTLPPLPTRSINPFSAVAAAAASAASGSETGLHLFEYTTGRSTSGGVEQTDNSDSTRGTSSYSFANQFSSSFGSSAHSRSPSVESTSSSSSTNISSPPLSSSNSSCSSSLFNNPNWSTVNGHGGDHYSVIGIRHGDWPEDRPTAGRWWGGGLNTNMTQESMIFLPWAAGPGGQGSVAHHRQWLLQQQQQEQGQRRTRGSKSGEDMEDVSPNNKDDHDCCSSKVHIHRMFQMTTRAHNPPAHHHRFLCLHHDQLMTDMAAYSSASAAASSAMAANAEQYNVKNESRGRPLAPLMSRAGSKYLSIDYGAKVMESKRCLFCLSSPCKANLEIQIKFDEVRVSLDWILSGF